MDLTCRERWTSGDYRTIALLSDLVPELAETLGKEPVSGFENGLGHWVSIGGELASGALVEMITYLDAPQPLRTEVRIDADTDELGSVLDEIMRALNLKGSAVLWAVNDLGNLPQKVRE